MKPQSQISRPTRSGHGESTPVRPRLSHPAIDFHYQATGADFRAAQKAAHRSTPSFRDLSTDFFAVETKRDYLTEALCFLILTGISAWPIVSMVRAFSLLK